MEPKRIFAIQSLLAILILNGLLIAAVYSAWAGLIPQVDPILVLFAAGGVVTVILWLVIWALGRRALSRAAAAPALAEEEAPPPKEPAESSRAAGAAAIQVLSLLQRQGRFIDFLQEDLSRYEDAQIGAAVRNIHAGCKEALAGHVRLEPVFKEPEGSEVTIEPDFDLHAIRLTGDVVGHPPFRGRLRHRGWRVVRIDLPERMPDRGPASILAPAEVEVKA